MPMTPEEHKERHKLLHKMFDELLADWIDHNINASIDDPVVTLMKWSYEQTKNPTEKET